MIVRSPCKDCPDRQLGCHSTCKKYLTYKEICETIREEKYNQAELENSLRKIHRKGRSRH